MCWTWALHAHGIPSTSAGRCLREISGGHRFPVSPLRHQKAKLLSPQAVERQDKQGLAVAAVMHVSFNASAQQTSTYEVAQ